MPSFSRVSALTAAALQRFQITRAELLLRLSLRQGWRGNSRALQVAVRRGWLTRESPAVRALLAKLAEPLGESIEDAWVRAQLWKVAAELGLTDQEADLFASPESEPMIAADRQVAVEVLQSPGVSAGALRQMLLRSTSPAGLSDHMRYNITAWEDPVVRTLIENGPVSKDDERSAYLEAFERLIQKTADGATLREDEQPAADSAPSEEAHRVWRRLLVIDPHCAVDKLMKYRFRLTDADVDAILGSPSAEARLTLVLHADLVGPDLATDDADVPSRKIGKSQ